ncbi:MAG: hypothetical protein KDA33_09690, partial [Phycisphaerales bacterium]|nr:hypothetical protein [Phycisphaerales bacterium]
LMVNFVADVVRDTAPGFVQPMKVGRQAGRIIRIGPPGHALSAFRVHAKKLRQEASARNGTDSFKRIQKIIREFRERTLDPGGAPGGFKD